MMAGGIDQSPGPRGGAVEVTMKVPPYDGLFFFFFFWVTREFSTLCQLAKVLMV